MTEQELNDRFLVLRRRQNDLRGMILNVLSKELCRGEGLIGRKVDFRRMVSLLRDRFGFDYDGYEEQDSVHTFEGEEYRLYIFPSKECNGKDFIVVDSFYFE